ncbi:MAG: aminofutalosine synthase MqnE [bacterium]|nr:aminofutalosine synthase MqnE [bacterium]
MAITTDTLGDIAERVEAGERLGFEDGVRLYRTRDIHALGRLADLVRRRRHGDTAYFNVNRHINYTNRCVLRCRFCSFYRPWDADAPDVYELTVDEVVERAGEAYAHGATEVHIVGGLHPKLPFSYYTEVCRRIRETCPHLHLKAFTAIEIIHFARIAKPRMAIREVLTELREAGLSSLPGGGAEIFDDRVHDEAFQNKVGETEWFEVHRTAHELGLRSNATMLYGHVETIEERVRHLLKLRTHQDESRSSRPGRFNCIVPLPFIPEGSALADLPGPTGLDDLRTLAVCRLLLDNFDHVKAFWIMQSPKLAQVSLNWGVDDLDGTVVYYDITKREGQGTTHQEMTIDVLKRLICEAGCVPVERDSLYRRVIRGEKHWSIEGEDSQVPSPQPETPRERDQGRGLAPEGDSRQT